MVRAWEAEIYPAIRAEAKAKGVRIYFSDESGICSDYHTGTTRAPLGETPVVEVTGRRFLLNMISAVSPQGEFRGADIRRWLESAGTEAAFCLTPVRGAVAFQYGPEKREIPPVQCRILATLRGRWLLLWP